MIDNSPRWVEVEAVGEATKEKYIGKFQLKPFLTTAEKADAQRLSDKYSIGIQEINQKNFLNLIAFLKFHIVDFEAHWWKDYGLSLLDEEPAYAVVNALDKLRNPPEEKKDAPT